METLGKYELLDKLADGISGSTYKARDKSLDRLVALIPLAADIRWDPALRKLFRDECHSLASLKHPNLAAFYEQGEDRKIIYVVTELLSGTNLKQLISEKSTLSLEHKLGIMVQAAAGLHHAHAHGIIHRNLHPAYVHILPEGKVKVAGLGFSLNHTPARTLTRSQEWARIYLSPEQLKGDPATRQSDIFSIGIVLFEFLTGIHPFHDDENAGIVEQILQKPLVAMVEHFPDLPMSLWPIVERCLGKLPEERYESMLQFGAACQAALEELAEDAECMRIELQAALPRLRKATRKVGAPCSLAGLQREIEQALSGGNHHDYQSLNRLALALAENHRLLDVSSNVSLPTAVMPDAFVPDAAMAGNPAEAESLKAPVASEVPLAESRVQNAEGASGTQFQLNDHRDTIQNKNGDLPAHLDFPSIQAPANDPAAANPLSPAASTRQPVSAAAGQKDTFSDLLRTIDQGQESTKKLVDSYLADQRTKGTTKARSGAQNNRPDAGTMGSELESSTSERISIQESLDAGASTAHLQELVSRIRPTGGHPSPAAGIIEATANSRRRGRHRPTIWIFGAMLVLTMAFAVPWIRIHLSPGSSRNALSGRNATSVDGLSKDAELMTLRSRLRSARTDILLEEAHILHVVGRLDESRIFLIRLLEMNPGHAQAQEELDRITAEISAPKEREYQPKPVKR